MSELHNKLRQQQQQQAKSRVRLRRWNDRFVFPSGMVNCEFYIGGESDTVYSYGQQRHMKD